MKTQHQKIRSMKRLLLCLPVLALLYSLSSCTQQRKWNHEQRQQMREALREYRTLAYLNDLTENEFLVFSDDVSTTLENDYPVYATFINMPGKDDTVQMVVVTTIVEELNADARNMRHLFPYRDLVKKGKLPAGLDRDQLHSFYNCMATKVNNNFMTLDRFVNAVLADTVNTSLLGRIQSQCANDLFDWEITEVEVIEQ